MVQQRSAAGDRLTGTGLQLLQCRGDDDGGRQPVVLPKRTGCQDGSAHCRERIVIALPLRPGIRPDLLVVWFTIDTRSFVVGIAHARCGQLGGRGIEGCPSLGVEEAVDRTHPVGLLPADPQVAPPRPIDIAELPVGSHQRGQSIGGFA